jgi:hypothetical protein
MGEEGLGCQNPRIPQKRTRPLRIILGDFRRPLDGPDIRLKAKDTGFSAAQMMITWSWRVARRPSESMNGLKWDETQYLGLCNWSLKRPRFQLRD